MSDNKAPDKAVMNKVYKEFGLTPNHVFAHKHYKIITRAGIDKIQAAANIQIEYEVILAQPSRTTYRAKKATREGEYEAALINEGDLNSVVIKATGVRYDADGKIVASVTSFGEASPSNCDNAYYMAIAEKRAMGRVVLKLAGLYSEDFFAEDEADAFGKAVREGRKRATVKGE